MAGHVILLLRTIPTRLENSHFALSPKNHNKHFAFLLQLNDFLLMRYRILEFIGIKRLEIEIPWKGDSGNIYI